MSGLTGVKCDLCGAASTQFVVRGRDRLRDRPEVYEVVRCSNCGLVYLDPRPTEETLATHYSAEYPIYSQVRHPLLRRLRERLLKHEARFVTRKAGKPGRLLEIGCGTGDLLAACECEGWQTVGVEISAHAAQLARQRCRGQILIGGLDQLGSADRFDAILLKYVLEHVPSPSRLLGDCAARLALGGSVFLWLSNAGSFDARFWKTYWNGYDMPRHLYDFDPASVARYCERFNFQIETICYGTLPNDWVRGVSYWIADHKSLGAAARLISMNSWALYAIFWPLTSLLAACGRSGRMLVVARAPALGRSDA